MFNVSLQVLVDLRGAWGVHSFIYILKSKDFDQRLISVPRSQLKYRGDRAFAVAGPRLWNSLPAYIRSAQSLTVFKIIS